MLLINDNVKQKREHIQKHIAKWQKKLDHLQNECQHNDHIKTYKSNTGNYDPMSDMYWVEHKCFSCGKFWTEDQ